jgi:Large polyvalent protein associated domain 29
MTENATTDHPRYIDVAEAAKMLRPILRAAFPGVKFSVRIDRYSMGASIDVAWTDGPTVEDVDKAARGFNGGRFESMTDCSYSANSWYCRKHGSCSAETYGCDLADNNGPTNSRCCNNAELVHFGTTSLGTRRTLSEGFTSVLAAQVRKKSGMPAHGGLDDLLPMNSPYAYSDFDTVRNGVYRLSLKTSRP